MLKCVAELFLREEIDGKGPADAVEWLEKAAEANDTAAQFQLGLLYLEGVGVDEDPSLAARWFELAAEQGHVPAQNNLGSLYENGRGVGQSFSRAFEWYERAAKQNDPFAQNNLGALYARGRGVDRNYAWAVFWFANAARGGNELALGNIRESREHLEQKTVAASRINIRAGNGTNHQRITQLEQGAKVYVLGSVDGWSHIYFEGEQGPMLGWVSNTLIE